MLRGKLVNFAEASLSSICFVELFAIRAPHSASDLATIVGYLEHLLLLEVFLLLNIDSAHAFADLHDGYDDPGDEEDHAQS